MSKHSSVELEYCTFIEYLLYIHHDAISILTFIFVNLYLFATCCHGAMYLCNDRFFYIITVKFRKITSILLHYLTSTIGLATNLHEQSPNLDPLFFNVTGGITPHLNVY